MIFKSSLVIGMSLFIVKIGGSVITDKSEKFSLRKDLLKRIAEELASIDEEIVLVHGGGSFGHPVASEYDISSGYTAEEQLEGFSETHMAMERLNSRIVDSLIDAGRPAIPVQTSASTVVEDDEIVSMDLQNLRQMLEMGITPVLYGDCVPDLEKGMTILSGDQLAAFLAKELGAEKVILGADVDGVFTGNPKKCEDAKLIPEITPERWNEISSSVDFPKSEDVTGGMRNKVEALLKLAEKGIESRIVNAKKPDILKKAIKSDKEVGTKIRKG